MDQHELSEIAFDEQDINLFLVEDARLRADALKHSVIPRLRLVMNSAIALVREIYGIEALDDSIVSVFPNFRTKRDRELALRYDSAFVGLGGQRKAKWPGFARKNGNPVQILPFRLAFVMTEDGLFTLLENGWLSGLHRRCYEDILRFHIENEDKLNPLCFQSHMVPMAIGADDLSVVAPFKEQYQYRIDHELFESHFIGDIYRTPISDDRLIEVVRNFACFYPIYDSYIQMAKSEPPRLDLLLAKLNNWLQRDMGIVEEDDSGASSTQEMAERRAAKLAESKVRVMPAIRWQVFQRDQWRCVSCGRNSHDDAILHVDHIVPRSLGGQDLLSNFQTLCDVCNVGKSNRDSTDLRFKE